MPLHEPAEVAGQRWSQQHHPGVGGLAQNAFDRAHRTEQPPPLRGFQPIEQRAHLVGRTLVEVARRLAPGVGQRHDLPAAVGGGPGAGEQSGRLELAEQPAEVARVEVERPPQVDHLGRIGLRDLEDHPSFGQAVRGVQQPLAEHADDPRVEAVERADLGDLIHCPPQAIR